MFSDRVIEQIRDRFSIEELVRQYVPLRKVGKELKARCPFHQEKTPSFRVSPERGLYHCFGCKKSGDIFSFLQEQEGFSFPDAVRFLAEKANIEIDEGAKDPSVIAQEKRAKELVERMYFACEVAAEFYERCLNDRAFSSLARQAIADRGVSEATASVFRLGYAPAEWDGLVREMRARGVSPADAETAGLLVPSKKQGSFYDRFRHRLMFPIFDRHGKIVAFSGRILPFAEGMPPGVVNEDAGKYINSPETPLYKKSETLFGLQVAKSRMRENAEAILVEGNFDVVTMHEHGFTETVAPLGTALTEAHVKLLRRVAETVTLAFDADEAGRKATKLVLDACGKTDLVVRVATLAADRGKDPDEVLRRPRGEEVLRDRLRRSVEIVQWYIDDVAAHVGDGSSERVGALRQVAPFVARVSDEILRERYVQDLVRKLYIAEKDVRTAVSEAKPFRANRPQEATPERSKKHDDFLRDVRGDLLGAFLRCPELAVGERGDRALALMGSGFAHTVLLTLRTQIMAGSGVNGPSLFELAPTDKARSWIASKIVSPVDQGEVSVVVSVIEEKLALLSKHAREESARMWRKKSEEAMGRGDRVEFFRCLQQAESFEVDVSKPTVGKGL